MQAIVEPAVDHATLAVRDWSPGDGPHGGHRPHRRGPDLALTGRDHGLIPDQEAARCLGQAVAPARDRSTPSCRAKAILSQTIQTSTTLPPARRKKFISRTSTDRPVGFNGPTSSSWYTPRVG